MGLIFEWNAQKAKQNLNKHGIPFEEAATVFADPLSLTIDDPQHSEHEERFVTIGKSFRKRVLIVIHTDRDHHIRIISSRLATPRERKEYEEGTEKD